MGRRGCCGRLRPRARACCCSSISSVSLVAPVGRRLVVLCLCCHPLGVVHAFAPVGTAWPTSVPSPTPRGLQHTHWPTSVFIHPPPVGPELVQEPDTVGLLPPTYYLYIKKRKKNRAHEERYRKQIQKPKRIKCNEAIKHTIYLFNWWITMGNGFMLDDRSKLNFSFRY